MRAPETLLEHPRLGRRLEEYEPREVRRLVTPDHEYRYEIIGYEIWILRVWHTREDR